MSTFPLNTSRFPVDIFEKLYSMRANIPLCCPHFPLNDGFFSLTCAIPLRHTTEMMSLLIDNEFIKLNHCNFNSMQVYKNCNPTVFESINMLYSFGQWRKTSIKSHPFVWVIEAYCCEIYTILYLFQF